MIAAGKELASSETNPGGKHNVLGVLVNAANYESVVARVIDAAGREEPLSVSALAVHGVMTGVLDSAHRYRLNRLDLVVPDGQPVRWALNLLHATGLQQRVYGPNMMLEVCRAAADAGLPIYLYGSTSEVLVELSKRLRERFPKLQIAGSEPSQFRQVTASEADAIAERIKRSGAKITFVGLGCPRQEVWAFEFRDRLKMPLLAVGAAFNFHAGLLPQAPSVLQSWGLEWLFRLLQEPRRLWRRYLYLNPMYLGLLALQTCGLKSFDPASATPPREELRYG